MFVFVGVLLGSVLLEGRMPACQAQEGSAETEGVAAEVVWEMSECEKAGGDIGMVEEYDGSMSEWCVISEKEQCYADQVKEGKCTVGHYDEQMQGIVGVTPRVFCEERKG